MSAHPWRQNRLYKNWATLCTDSESRGSASIQFVKQSVATTMQVKPSEDSGISQMSTPISFQGWSGTAMECKLSAAGFWKRPPLFWHLSQLFTNFRTSSRRFGHQYHSVNLASVLSWPMCSPKVLATKLSPHPSWVDCKSVFLSSWSSMTRTFVPVKQKETVQIADWLLLQYLALFFALKQTCCTHKSYI